MAAAEGAEASEDEDFPTDIPCFDFDDGEFVPAAAGDAATVAEAPASSSSSTTPAAAPSSSAAAQEAPSEAVGGASSGGASSSTAGAAPAEADEEKARKAAELAEAKRRASEAVAAEEQAAKLAEAKGRAAKLAEAKLRAASLADSMMQVVDVEAEPQLRAPVGDDRQRLAGALEHQKRLEAALGPSRGLDRKKRRMATPEEERQMERQKRKNLWEIRPDCFEDLGNRARPTNNGWEMSEMSSAKEKDKFLRLLGGSELARQARAHTPQVVEDSDDEAENAKRKEDEIDEEDLPADVPCFDFDEGDGEFKAVENPVPAAAPAPEISPGLPVASTQDVRVMADLQQQYSQALRQGNSRAGLGRM